MAKLVTLQATYRLVTPMFLGGAEPNELANTIRPPSVKGALRFWWRFLYWSTFRAERDDVTAILSMQEREDDLFGSARTGQGRFVLSIVARLGRERVCDWPINDTGSGYLGFGLFPTGQGVGRTAFDEKALFDVILQFHPASTNEDVEQIKRTLIALGLFGGMGGRGQRRGFGSVAIARFGQESLIFRNREDYLQYASGFLTALDPITDCPPFSAVSSETAIAAIATGDQAREVHDALGEAYKDYRKRFPKRERMPFGLPLATVDAEKRRASPLLFHVHPTGNPKFTGIALYIPAVFHPDYSSTSLQIIDQFMESYTTST